MAAVLYILAEAFDGDPFLILAWRGRAREELLARLRARRAPEETPSAGGEAPASGSDVEVAALPVSPAGFWGTGEEMASLRLLPRAPEAPDGILAPLGTPPPGAGGRELAGALRSAYRALTRGAERLAFGEER